MLLLPTNVESSAEPRNAGLSAEMSFLAACEVVATAPVEPTLGEEVTESTEDYEQGTVDYYNDAQMEYAHQDSIASLVADIEQSTMEE